MELIVNRFIEDAGNLTQSLGIGRVIGQIYAYLYFSPESKNLVDMQTALAVSKGSASTAVRQLEQWGAVRKVWVKGDRKDYYEAIDWLGGIIKSALMDTVEKKIDASSQMLGNLARSANNMGSNGQGIFIKERIAKLRDFQDKLKTAWNNPEWRKFISQ